jgi:hypothetical protein
MATQAQHWPKPGEAIPLAVEDVPGEPPFVYPFRWQAGDIMREGMGTLQYTLDQQVRAGAILPAQAEESARNAGITDYHAPTD